LMTETTDTPSPFHKPKLVWYGPVNSLGYGQASSGYVSGLVRRGTFDPIRHELIGDMDMKDPEVREESLMNSLALARANIELGRKSGLYVDPPPTDVPAVGFWHFSQAEKVGEGSERVIISTFEVDDFPQGVMDKLSSFDSLGTASTWGADVLRKRFPGKRVFSTPHAFFPTSEHNETLAHIPKDHKQSVDFWSRKLDTKLPANTQLLTSIGKFEKRKGHNELLDTVIDIGKDRPITLLASWFNPFMNQNYPFFAMHERDMRPVLTKEGFFGYSKGKALVILLPRIATRGQLIGAMLHSDTYVSPAYCEGWDLPLFEMMTHGAHCIATLNTGHLDYCTTTNVMPMQEIAVEPAIDGTPFFSGQGKWNRINPMELRHCIDNAWSMDPEARMHMQAQAKATCSQFSWEKSAAVIENEVIAIQKEKAVVSA